MGGGRKDAPGRQYVAEALDAVLEGRRVAIPEAPVFGCLIERTKASTAGRSLAKVRSGGRTVASVRKEAEASPAIETVTYSGAVAIIVQNKCQYCHRPGQAAPFSLLTYAQVRRHAAMIREVVDEQRMPPWHADARYGQFANDRSLSPQERRTLLTWIDQGMPEGDPKAMPSPRAFAEGWAIGTPDVVLSMPEVYTVPAEGTVPYQHFRVATGFTEDRWVQAAEVQPGDRSVVHHIFVRVIPAGRLEETGQPKEPFFAAFVVGDAPSIFPPERRGRFQPVPNSTSRSTIARLECRGRIARQSASSSRRRRPSIRSSPGESRTACLSSRQVRRTMRSNLRSPSAATAICSASCRTCTCAVKTSATPPRFLTVESRRSSAFRLMTFHGKAFTASKRPNRCLAARDSIVWLTSIIPRTIRLIPIHRRPSDGASKPATR